MRTIKFRAWIHVADDYNVYDDNEEKFPIHEMIYQDGHNVASFFNEVVDYSEQDIVDIMQFTGLHDKNGVEIYEGDIIRFTYNNYGDYDIKIVKFGWCDDGEYCCYNGWYFQSTKKSDYYINNRWIGDDSLMSILNKTDSKMFDHIQVIGNIYENPELL